MLLVQFLFPLKMAGETLYLKLHLFHAFIICNVFFLSTCVISAPIFFKVGFILDRNRVPETDNLYLSLNYLKQKYSQDNIDFSAYFIDDPEPNEALQKLCKLASWGASVVVSQTSCSTARLLESIAFQWKLPHIVMGETSKCNVNERKPSLDSFSSVVARADFDRSAYVIVQIMQKTAITNNVIFYDETFDFSYARFLQIRLHDAAAQHKIQLETKFIKINSKKNTQLSSELAEIQGNANYFRFVILGNAKSCSEVLKQATRIGLTGQQFLWVIGNVELDVSLFAKLSDKLNLISVTRSYPDTTYRRTKSGRYKLIPPSKTQNWEFQPLVNAAELALVAMNDSKNSVNFSQVKDLDCSDMQDRLIFMGGMRIRSEMSKTHSLRVLVNDYYGRSHFFDMQGSIGLESQGFQMMPNMDVLVYNASRDQSVNKDGQVSAGGKDEELTDWVRISRFSVNELSWIPPESTFRSTTGSLDGKVLRVVTIVEEPFIMKSVDANGNVTFSGYCIDILKLIQAKALEKFGERFSFEIYEVADGSYGVFDEEKQKWSGLIGDILLRKADIAVAGMIRNFDREQVVDFTAPYMDYGVGILIRKSNAEINIFSFLEPLTIPIWALIALSCFIVSLLMFALAHLSPYEIEGDGHVKYFTYFNCVFWVMGALTQQGGEYNPTATSNRILGTAFWYFSLVVVATYTANLAAFLTTGRLATPIESLSDLANQEAIPYGTVKGSSLEAFFKDQAETTDVETYKTLWNQMRGDPSPMVRSIAEGYDRVQTSSYAFMWDYPVLQYQMQKNCQLMMVGKPFNRKNYAFAVPKAVHFLPTISLSILSLQEQGSLGSLREKWFEGTSMCGAQGEEGSNAPGLTFDNIGGIFYLMAGGGLLSIVINFMENIWFKFMRKIPQPAGADQVKTKLLRDRASSPLSQQANTLRPTIDYEDFEGSLFSAKHSK